jgi:hypothetical protein
MKAKPSFRTIAGFIVSVSIVGVGLSGMAPSHAVDRCVPLGSYATMCVGLLDPQPHPLGIRSSDTYVRIQLTKTGKDAGVGVVCYNWGETGDGRDTYYAYLFVEDVTDVSRPLVTRKPFTPKPCPAF